MKRFIIGCYLLIITCLATATFVEKVKGTPFVDEHIYHSFWFIALWGFLTLPACWYLLKQKVYKRKEIFLLHASFVLILAGACLTYFTGKQGVVHLRQGEAPLQTFKDMDTGVTCPLPFAIGLDTFYIHYYPGTEAPANYISRIYTNEVPRQEEEVSMNHIFSHHGYRFYQSSFDDDLHGTWLSVNYDPWGIPVTYAGYTLLLIAVLWILIAPGSNFRRLLKHPLLQRAGIIILLCCWTATTQAKQIRRQDADTYRTRQVIYNDRIVPLNTLARDFVIKLTGQDHYKGLSPEQILLGWLLYPDEWQNEPMIQIKSKELQQHLGCGPYARLTDFFDSQKGYRLQEYWNRLHQSGKQNALLKAITEADEKISLISMLRQGTLVHPVPEKGVERLSETKVQAELLYNRIPFSTILYRINLTLGLLLFLCQWCKHSPFRFRTFRRITFSLLLGSFLFQTMSMALRTYISGRLPMSNGYETMQFMAWLILLTALCLQHRFSLMACFGFLLSGFTLLVASIGQMNPQITPLMPVLSSPLLSLHVSLIMMSYALLGFMFLNGVAALIYYCRQNGKEQVERLTLLSRILLYPAALILAVGIFIGAIWANVSWGRYWAWDPKEVWALITLLVYGMAFHTQSIRAFRKPLFFHLFLIIAFATVLMTYFGVNYFLGGMHSYANS